jgi:hypothetical protein
VHASGLQNSDIVLVTRCTQASEPIEVWCEGVVVAPGKSVRIECSGVKILTDPLRNQRNREGGANRLSLYELTT